MPSSPKTAGGSGDSGDKTARGESSIKVPAKGAVKDKDLSEEDLALKQQLELYVKRAQDPDPSLQAVALQGLSHEIRTAISSMTSVPKPLKFLRPHYGTLKSHYENMPDSDAKKLMADILSVLALTMSAEGERESLKYRLLGSDGDVGSWGHEYVRNLAAQVTQEYADILRERTRCFAHVDDLRELAEQIVAFYMKHNAEPEAVDLILEALMVEYRDLLVEHVGSENYKRTCLYLQSAAKYLPDPDDLLVLEYAYIIYTKFEQYESALLIALRLDEMEEVRRTFISCNDILRKKQFCYILAHHHATFELDKAMCAEGELEELKIVINNSRLSEGYLALARDIGVMEPISPEDIYKAHLLVRHGVVANVDSARQNLAATFVNAFVNAGFGQDKLMIVPSESSGEGSSTSWLFKNKEHGKASAAASVGMILLWDVDAGLAQIDKYFHITDTHVTAGALLAVGVVHCNVKNDYDHAFSLLAGYVNNPYSSIRIGAIIGLGLAYAGSQDIHVYLELSSILRDTKAPLDVIAFTAVSLGLVYVGSCSTEVALDIVHSMMKRSESELGDALGRFLPLSLGLLYLGKQDAVDNVTYEVSSKLNDKIKKYCAMALLSCAYAGTRNVLKVQYFLGECAQHFEKGGTYQGPAVLGIAMVAMGEELGLDMAVRSLEHLLQYGELNIRRVVPLALGLLCISNPKVNVMNTLSRLSHDSDPEVAMAAIISLGLIGAGTNNARIAGILRSLSSYYYKGADLLFCVRIAQGIVHLGKGLLTLTPYHSDRFLASPTSLAGLLVVLHACLDMNALILGKYHYILYFLTLAMKPRMLMTVDEDLKPLLVPVRVGKAVDVVSQAGQPKTITGFRTHLTPVLLGAGERAELATDKYIPLSPVLEGFVILKKNPEYQDNN